MTATATPETASALRRMRQRIAALEGALGVKTKQIEKLKRHVSVLEEDTRRYRKRIMSVEKELARLDPLGLLERLSQVEDMVSGTAQETLRNGRRIDELMGASIANHGRSKHG
jgi:predicted  nucleic acid-binding Zn-ribbon protein